jgi:hypothetical protein
MKVTLEVVIEGNITLSASAEVKTLKDIATLGKRIAALPSGVKKAVPDLYASKVVKLHLPKEKADAASA